MLASVGAASASGKAWLCPQPPQPATAASSTRAARETQTIGGEPSSLTAPPDQAHPPTDVHAQQHVDAFAGGAVERRRAASEGSLQPASPAAGDGKQRMG